jgi:hypothetical protein
MPGSLRFANQFETPKRLHVRLHGIGTMGVATPAVIMFAA